jgi:hypothetical protein
MPSPDYLGSADTSPYAPDDDDLQRRITQGMLSALSNGSILPPPPPTAQALPPPPETAKAYLPGDTDFPSPPPAARTPAPSPVADYSAYDAATNALQRELSGAPQVPKPKWWNYALAAGGGALGGYQNATGRTRPVDIGRISQNMLYPGYAGKMAAWQSRVSPLREQQEIEAARLKTKQGGQAVAAEIGLHGAQAKKAEAEAADLGDTRLRDARIAELISQAKKNGQLDLAQRYANAVQAAIDRGDDPEKDQTAQRLAHSITAIQRPPAVKEPSRDDKAIAIYQNEIKLANPGISDDKAYEQAYGKWIKQTKTEPGVLRIEALGETRGVPMLDTKNGNAPVMMNWNDINTGNATEPGRFIPSQTSVAALNKTALLEDIRGNVQQVRQSLQAIPNFDAMDKAKIALALRSRDPRGSLNALISGGAAGSMTPEQQDYLINVTNLIENAMAMRSVLGAGQGSEDLRDAVKSTIPGPSTPSREYALKQLDTFERVLNRLERGVPKVPLRQDLNPGGNVNNSAAPVSRPPLSSFEK